MPKQSLNVIERKCFKFSKTIKREKHLLSRRKVEIKEGAEKMRIIRANIRRNLGLKPYDI